MPELAAYAELYNAKQDTYRIHVRGLSGSEPFILDDGQIPDLVAGPNLHAQGGSEYYQSLDYVFPRAEQPREKFYPSILNSGMDRGVQILMPLSFDLLILLMKNTQAADLPGLTADLPTVLEKARSLNALQDRNPSMGLSLYWDPELIKSLLFHFQADFSAPSPNQFSWNHDGLAQGLKFITESWKANGGELEDRFSYKYTPAPAHRLLNSDRVAFYPSSLVSLFRTPGSERAALDLRYPTLNGKILPYDRIVYLGIPKNAFNKPAAEDFLAWLFRTTTQKELLSFQREKKISSFGLAGGLSSLVEITENDIPQQAPTLKEVLPPPALLSFPPPIPSGWDERIATPVLQWIDEHRGNDSVDALEAFINEAKTDFN